MLHSRSRPLFWCFLGLMALARPSRAQLPGVPVLQNAFGNPGFTAAGNFAGGSGVSTFDGAAGFGTSSQRVLFSVGLGLFTPDNGNGRFSYGGRISTPLLGGTGDSRFGLGVFVGIGGAGSGSATTAAGPDTTSSAAVTLIPVGLSFGYRMAVGSAHGFSIYGSPIVTWYNKDGSGAGSGAVFRASVGTDIGITPTIGLTFGLEFGASADTLSNGPRGTLFGVGLSYAFGRR